MSDRITQALEDILADIQVDLDRLARGTVQGEPDAAKEAKYFRAQRGRYQDALAMHQGGTRITWTGRSAVVPSSSRPGALAHRLWQDGGVWRCSCEAGDKGLFCKHHALLTAYERAGELVDAHDDGMETAPDCRATLPDPEPEPPRPAPALRLVRPDLGDDAEYVAWLAFGRAA